MRYQDCIQTSTNQPYQESKSHKKYHNVKTTPKGLNLEFFFQNACSNFGFQFSLRIFLLSFS